MKTVKYGIIGMGNMGSGHMNSFCKGLIPNAVVSAVADINPEKLSGLSEKFPGQNPATYRTGTELIENADVDAVIIAVPHYLHPELSILALSKNIHVICEKPAGVYTAHVREMNEVAKASKALFTMMFNQRTNCLYRKMREMILGGELGEIRRINWIITNWYRSQSYYDSSAWRATWSGEGGGVLINQCPHQLDLLQWVTGMMPAQIRAVCGFGKWHDIEVEDDVTAFLSYANGATGVFVTTTGDAPGTNRLEVTGDRGKLVCENDKLTFIRLKMSEREFNRTHRGGFGSPESETVEVETDGNNEQHVGIIKNFTNAILGTEQLFVDGTEGIKGVEIMNAMLMSGWLDGAPVSLPVDEDAYLQMLNEKIKHSKVVKSGGDTVLNTEGTYGGKK